VICPSRHVIRKSSILRHAYAYRALSPLSSLREAILKSAPDLIVSADDLATLTLIELYNEERAKRSSDPAIRESIERSLGPMESFRYMNARKSFMDLASEAGVRVPQTAEIKGPNDLEMWLRDSRFPFVLKTDGSSSGEGTRIVSTPKEAHDALQSLRRPVEWIRVLKRVIVNYDLRSVRARLERRRPVVNAQNYIAGRDATTLVACWKGEVLGALHFEVLEKQRRVGPASVLRQINHPEIEAFSRSIASKLRLSGLHGFDFLLEEKTGLPYMIEFNPRATQVGHLTLGQGKDLPGALYAAVTGTQIRVAPKLTDNQTIALFPQESVRDPRSPYLTSAYHDAPIGQPELVRACLRQVQTSVAQQFISAYSHIFSNTHVFML
jgi:hypothetical protein